MTSIRLRGSGKASSRLGLRIAARCGSLILLASVSASVPAALAQNYFNPEDFSSERLYATGEIGVSARALGLAGAYSAVSDDAAALYYNPAGLAQVRRIEMRFGLQHQGDSSTHGMFGVERSANTRHTGLDEVAVAYPFPTYRGSLVAGFGLFRSRSDELQTSRRDLVTNSSGVLADNSFQRAQRGGLWRLAGGFGVDLLESLSFGASLSYWHGKLEDDQYATIFQVNPPGPPIDETERRITDASANGISFDIGLLGYATDQSRLALVLHSPTWLWIRGDGSQQLVDRTTPANSNIRALFIEDKARLPWSAALGLSLSPGNLLVSGELRYTAWDEFELDRDPTDLGAPPPGQPSDYSAKLGLRGGAELLLPLVPIRLRGGYGYDPLAYERMLGNPAKVVRQHQFVTAGAGIIVADAFTLDAAAFFGRFKRADAAFPQVFEKRTEQRFFLTGAYRF